MAARHCLFRQRTIQPPTIFRVGFAVVGLAAMLWVVGADRGAMQMLLASLLFGLLTYGAYLSNPSAGRLALRQGGLTGGLVALIGVVVVVGRHSDQTRGSILPRSVSEVVMLLGVALGVFVPFGAGIGGMMAVLGGWTFRTAHQAAGWPVIRGKPRQQPTSGDWSA